MLSPTKTHYRRDNIPELQAVAAHKSQALLEASLCEEKQLEDLKHPPERPLCENEDLVLPQFRLREAYTRELQIQSRSRAETDWKASLCTGKKEEDQRSRWRAHSEPRSAFEQHSICSASSAASTSAGSTFGTSSRSSRGRSQPPVSPTNEKVEELRNQIAELRRTTEVQVQNILKANSLLGFKEIAEVAESMLARAQAMESRVGLPTGSHPAAVPTFGAAAGTVNGGITKLGRTQPAATGNPAYRKATNSLQRLQLLCDIGDDLKHIPTDKLKNRLARADAHAQEALAAFGSSGGESEEALATIIRGTEFSTSTDKLKQRLVLASAFAQESLAVYGGRVAASDAGTVSRKCSEESVSTPRGGELKNSASDKLRQRLARVDFYAQEALAAYGSPPAQQSFASEALGSSGASLSRGLGLGDSGGIGGLGVAEGGSGGFLDGRIDEEPPMMDDSSPPVQQAPAAFVDRCRAEGDSFSGAEVCVEVAGEVAAATGGCPQEGPEQPRPASFDQALGRMTPEELSLVASALGKHLPPSGS